MTVTYSPKRIPDLVLEAFPTAKVTAQEGEIHTIELPSELSPADLAKLEALIGRKVAKVTAP